MTGSCDVELREQRPGEKFAKDSSADEPEHDGRSEREVERAFDAWPFEMDDPLDEDAPSEREDPESHQAQDQRYLDRFSWVSMMGQAKHREPQPPARRQ